MADTNFTTGRQGFYEHIPDAEIDKRWAIVRAEKIRLGRNLKDEDLDRILDPVPCKRTRARLARAKGAERA